VADRIEFVYDVQGAQQSAAAVEALAQAMEVQAAAAGQAAEGQQALDQTSSALTEQLGSLRAETDRLRSAQVASASSLGQVTAAASSLGSQINPLAQRIQGVAGAVQGLVSATGSSDRTAGLIGSIAGATAQMAAMGAVLGPGGALVGGIVGLTTGIMGAVEAHNAAEEAARRQSDAAVALAASLRTAEERTRSLSEALSENARLSRVNMALGSASDYAREIDTVTERYNEVIAARNALRGEFFRAPAPDTPEGRAFDDLAREAGELLNRTAELRRLAAAAEAESVAIMSEDLASAANPPTTTARRGGGRRARTIEDILGTEAASNADIGAMGAAAEEAARAAESERAARERAEAEREADAEKERRTQELEALEDKRHQRKLQQIETEREARRRADEERRRRLEQETRILEDFGSTVGGVFAGAFEAAITGQESFDAALLKGTKRALVQYGTTMVAEGIGALLTAAGNVVINPPAAASKAIEGAGKVALGVGLGAAGAAIPTPGAGAGAQPERPQNQTPPDASSGAGAPIVLNMSAPTVMGGTHAEVGRSFIRATRDARLRFGGSA